MVEVGLLPGLRPKALHLICATNRVPISYELTPANVAEVSLTEELLAEANFLGEDLARRLLGDLAYRNQELEEDLAELGILLVTERAKQRRGARQQIEIAFSSLKRVFGLGETLAKTLVGLATRIATKKIAAYTPTPSWSIGFWAVLKVGSRICGLEPSNTHLARGRGVLRTSLAKLRWRPWPDSIDSTMRKWMYKRLV